MANRFPGWRQLLLVVLFVGAASSCQDEDAPGPCAGYGALVTIETATEWDAFASSGCTSLDGDLLIYAANPARPSPLMSVGGRLYLGGLGEMDGDPLAALASVGGNVVVEPGVTILRLPSLASGGSVTAVNSDLVTVDLPALTTAGDVVLWRNGALSAVGMPALETLDGPIGLSIDSNPALTSLSLPSLATLDATAGLGLAGNALLSTIDFPALASVGASVLVIDNPKLAAVYLANLQTVEGDFAVADSASVAAVDLPLLSTVGGDVSLVRDDSLADAGLPMLGTIGRNLFLEFVPVASAIDLGALASIGNGLFVDDTGLAVLSLPSLASVGKGPFDAGFSVDSNDALTAIAVPVLASVEGNFNVNGNPSLPDCMAWAIHDQLVTFGGAANIFGNDAGATCP